MLSDCPKKEKIYRYILSSWIISLFSTFPFKNASIFWGKTHFWLVLEQQDLRRKKFFFLPFSSYWRYNEICKYDFSKPEWSTSTGHFTQIVWASTSQLGLGWATKDEDSFLCYYVAGRYSPSGNIDNKFEENVMKGSFDPSYCSSKRRNLKSVRDVIWPKWYNRIVRSLHQY